MNFNIDVLIFVSFLIITLFVGIYYGRNVKTIEGYALGGRSFDTSSLVSTIVATCVGGGFFSAAVSETYKNGLYFIIPALGEPISLIIIGTLLVPRMGEFLGELSTASVMGKIYGRHVQLITGITSVILCIGVVALQFKVSSVILQMFFHISSFYAVIASSFIVMVYSAFGGIRSVTFTDILQVVTFSFVIPVISLIIWGTFDSPSVVLESLNNNSTLSLKSVFDLTNLRFWDSFLLFLFFIMPGIQPVFFQRISMAKSVIQAKRALVIGGSISAIILLIICWIGILVLSINDSLDSNFILSFIIDNYAYTGLKGVICIGIMSIVMSTSDSYINSASVIINHDILKSFKLNFNKLLLLRCTTVFVGIFSFVLAFRAGTILEILLTVFSFHGPIITVPFLLVIFGFRSNYKAVLIGMLAALITVILIKILNIPIEPVIPGMLSNLVFFTLIHYFFYKGSVKNYKSLKSKKRQPNTVSKLYNKIIAFNFIDFCRRNIPKEEGYYTICALFFMISIFSTMYSIPQGILYKNQFFLSFIYHSVLIISSGFLTYAIWPKRFKNNTFISIFWTITLPYVLVIASSLLVMVSNFGQLQLMIFLIDLIILSMFFRWHTSIMMIVVGTCFSYFFYGYLIVDQSAELTTMQFKITYSLLLVSSILVVFLKPKQENQHLIEQKNCHLTDKVELQRSEIVKSTELKNEFLRNVPHESNNSLTPILGFGRMLYEQYDRLSDNERKEMSKHIADSSNKLESLVNNIFDLSDLSSDKYKINKKAINLSDLVYVSLEKCRRLYIDAVDSENRVWDVDIQDDIILNCDEYYIGQTVDNLIINAIQYCKEGRIGVSLKKENKGNYQFISFVISDEGIGIPSNEIDEIFNPFITSSKTRKIQSGRGIGLTLSKKVIELHDGKITVEANQKKGSIFSFLLPI
jgi:Na+/proline symporter/signal transduction histidine kinase